MSHKKRMSVTLQMMNCSEQFNKEATAWQELQLSPTLTCSIKPSITTAEAVITGVRLWENGETVVVVPEGTGHLVNPLLIFAKNEHGKFFGRCSLEELPIILTNFAVGNEYKVDGAWSAKLINLYAMYSIVEGVLHNMKGQPHFQSYEAQIVRGIYSAITRVL